MAQPLNDVAALTVEPQYAPLLSHQPERFGLMSGHAWATDPKRIVFSASRYKFVAKMLEGKAEVLEVGCADAMFTRIVQQHVRNLTAIDIDQLFVDDVLMRMDSEWPMRCFVHDLRVSPPRLAHFDAVYSLDVLEHISTQDEHSFLRNLTRSLKSIGVAVIGMPSLESQPLASMQSRIGHVNCKSGPQFKATMERYFHSVFMFSMNDEVVHTGHHAMAHYLLAVCAHPRTVV